MLSILNTRHFLVLILTCTLFLGATFKSNAQTVISPGQGSRGSNLTVTISNSDIAFQQASSTVCPNKLKVNTSNIVFQQGSSTLYPTSVSTNNGVIQASLSIPNNTITGYYNVTIGQGEGCPSIVNAGFYISDRSIDVNPTTANKGQTLTVNISGTGVNFQQGSPTVCPSQLNVNTSNVIFRQGSSTIYPSAVSVNNGQISAQVTIPSNANGYYNVEVGDASCSITKYSGLYITSPSITVYPYSANKGQNLSVSISGTGVDFHQGSPTICPSHLNVNTSNVVFKQGSTTIYPSAVSVINGQLVAQVSIPNEAYGSYDVVVGDASCSVTQYNGFYVNQPSLIVTPGDVNLGQTLNVNIAGIGINFVQGSSTICPTQLSVSTSNVYFQQGSSTIYPSNISINNGTITAQITVPTNAYTGYYNLIVGKGENCSLSKDYALVINNPYISTPTYSTSVGKTLNVTITGTGLNFNQGSSTICPSQLNVTTSNVVFQQGSNTIYPSNLNISNNQIIATVTIPNSAAIGSYNTIVGFNGTCNYISYNTINITNPSISIYPSSGVTNQHLSVTIYGNGINFNQGSSTVCPNNLNISTSEIMFVSGSEIFYPSSVSVTGSTVIADVQIPSNAPTGFYDVIVGAFSGCPIVQSNAFVVTKPYISAYPYYTYEDNNYGIIINGTGVSFTQESSTSCPDLVNVNTSNIYITDLSDASSTFYPTSVNIVDGSVHCSFPVPNYATYGYNLVVGNQTACSYSTKVYTIIEGNLNSESDRASGIKIYPNPSDGNNINLDLTKKGTFEITVINPYGQSIGTKTVNGPSNINLPEIISEKLNSGMYLININDGKNIRHEKFVVQ